MGPFSRLDGGSGAGRIPQKGTALGARTLRNLKKGNAYPRPAFDCFGSRCSAFIQALAAFLCPVLKKKGRSVLIVDRQPCEPVAPGDWAGRAGTGGRTMRCPTAKKAQPKDMLDASRKLEPVAARPTLATNSSRKFPRSQVSRHSIWRDGRVVLGHALTTSSDLIIEDWGPGERCGGCPFSVKNDLNCQRR